MKEKHERTTNNKDNAKEQKHNRTIKTPKHQNQNLFIKEKHNQ